MLFPQRNPLIPVWESAPTEYRAGDHPLTFHMNHAQYTWFNQLTGELSADECVQAYSRIHGDESAALRHLIHSGIRTGALVDGSAVPTIARWLSRTNHREINAEMTHALLTYQDVSPASLAQLIDRRRSRNIYIAGSNYLSEHLVHTVDSIGLLRTPNPHSADLTIYASVSNSQGLDHAWSEDDPRPHVHVGIRHTRAVVGPLVVPGQSSCLRCVYLHRVDRDSSWPAQSIAWRHTQAASTADPLLLTATAAYAAALVRTWVDDRAPVNAAWSCQLPIPTFAREERPPHPLCSCRLRTPWESPMSVNDQPSERTG
ncbi:MAG: hypothetical protein K9G05_05065 [Candidatus Nanopelagicales bacterium]|nr:hypothetical protein [Candidatus Nanopelagicales bacterium]